MISAYLRSPSESSPHQRRQALAAMARRVALPILLTSATTSLGFFSNVISEVKLVRDFGIATGMGMAINFLITILLVPLLLSLFDPTKFSARYAAGCRAAAWAKLIACLEGLWIDRRRWLVLAWIGITALCALFATRLNATTDPLAFFSEEAAVVEHTNHVHSEMAGVQLFYITVELPDDGAFLEPRHLLLLERIQKAIADQGVFDLSVSLADHLALVHQEMNGGDGGFHRLPETSDLVEQYLLFFHDETLSRYVSHDFKRAAVWVRHNVWDSHTLNDGITDLATVWQSAEGEVLVSGKNLLVNKASDAIVVGQITILLRTPGDRPHYCSSLVHRSLRFALLALVPNLIPAAVVFGLMGLLGIPLTPNTAVVATLALAIAIDDTLHLLEGYTREIKRGRDSETAAVLAVRSQVVPVVTTSVGLIFGFLIFSLSSFKDRRRVRSAIRFGRCHGLAR